MGKDTEKNGQSGAENKENEGKIHRPNFIPLNELLAHGSKEIPHLVDGLFPKTGMVSIVGASDVGKGALLRQLGLNVIADDNFLDFRVHPVCKRVIYVSTEDPEDAFRPLVWRQLSVLGYDDDEALSRMKCVFWSDHLVNDLEAELSEYSSDLIILDAYSDLFDGKDLSTSAQVRRFLRPYDDLAKKHGCLIVWVHHVNKDAEGKSANKKNATGSQAFEAKMRVVVELQKKSGGDRTLTITKGNYIPDSEKMKAHVLTFDPESLTFKNTDDVIPVNNSGKKKAPGAKTIPEEVDEPVRKQILEGVFTRNDKPDTNWFLGKGVIRSKIIISAESLNKDISDRGSRIWFDHYLEMGGLKPDDAKQHPKYRFVPNDSS
ncbi:AAA family ATPase [Bacteroidota bacterium]